MDGNRWKKSLELLLEEQAEWDKEREVLRGALERIRDIPEYDPLDAIAANRAWAIAREALAALEEEA